MKTDPAVDDALFNALVAMHQRRQRGPGGSDAGSYAHVLRHFAARGQRLHNERLVIEQLIARTFASVEALAPAPRQHELVIVGDAGAHAAGRFRLENRTRQTVRPTFVVGECIEGGLVPPLSFEPERAELAAGAAMRVRVSADLRAVCEARSLTVPIECRAADQRDRLWLVITAQAESRP
jgi:hypothetical protein